MKHTSRFVLALVFCIHAGVPLVWSETGRLLVLVQDLQNKPVQGVEIGIEGAGDSGVSGSDGKVVLQLSRDTNENDPISLYVLRSSHGKDFVILGPKERTVPSFKDKPANVVKIMVVARKELKELVDLHNGTVVKPLTEQLTKDIGSKTSYKQAGDDPASSSYKAQTKANLEAVAKQYGLQPDELDKAIRAWGTKAVNPYDKGLAEYYQGNYDKATPDLQASLSQWEQKSAADQKADEEQVAATAFLLGSSLYQQGRYEDAVVAYQKALRIQPNDSFVLNSMGNSFLAVGDYSSAEGMFRRALAIDERAVPQNDLQLATSYNNLGLALSKRRTNFAEAEQNYQQALTLNERTLGHNNPTVAVNLSNLADVYINRGQYDEAKSLLEEALAIDERTLGFEHLEVAADLNNLGELLAKMGDYRGAEDLYRRSLRIREAKLGQEHPLVAMTQSNLGAALNGQDKFLEAEPLLVKALAIKREKLRANAPSIATTLTNLSSSLAGRGQYEEAECLCQEARSIDEEALGPENPEVATDIYNLASLLAEKKDYVGAGKLFQEALAIDERAVESGYPKVSVARDLDALEDLAGVLASSGHYPEAEEKLKQSLAIEEIVFGSGDARTQRTRRRLNRLHHLSSRPAVPTTKK